MHIILLICLRTQGINALMRSTFTVQIKTNKEKWNFKYEDNDVLRAELTSNTSTKTTASTATRLSIFGPNLESHLRLSNYLFLRPLPPEHLLPSKSQNSAKGFIIAKGNFTGALFVGGSLTDSCKSCTHCRGGILVDCAAFLEALISMKKQCG